MKGVMVSFYNGHYGYQRCQVCS